MKRNKFFMLGIVTVLVAVLSLTFVSNTFAKYTSTVTGSDSATVAKWLWEYSEEGATAAAIPSTIEFDLFNTINDSNGAAETDVANGLIAPGTKGEFEFELANKSQVNAKAIITLSSELENYTAYLPIQFKLYKDSVSATPLATADNLATFNSQLENVVLNMNGSAKYVITWEWVFVTTGNASDSNDTALGTAAQNGNIQYNVSMTVVMEQVD